MFKSSFFNRKKAVASVFVTLLFNTCSHTVYEKSIYKDEPVVVDGNPSEWQTPLNHYDRKTKLLYAIANDRENLYICLQAADRQTQARMFAEGMEVWIDTTGRSKKITGIQFPLPHPGERGQGMRNRNNDETGQNQNAYRTKFTSPQEFVLSGFHYPIGGNTPTVNVFGIKAVIKRDSTDMITYEATIPFKTFYKDSLAMSDTTKKISIGFTLNAMAMSGRSGGSGSGGGGMRGGGGMHGGGMHGGGGGMHGGGGGGRQGTGDAESISQEQEYWTNFNFSLK